MGAIVIVDTSIIVKWLNQNNENNIAQADKLMETALRGDIDLFAPELSKYELGNVLLRGKRLSLNEASVSLGTAYSLPINFISETEEMAKETYSLAINLGTTYYDASFLSLAKKYNATLITENIKHQGKAKNIKVKALRDFSI